MFCAGSLLGTRLRRGCRVPIRQAAGAAVGHLGNDHFLRHCQPVGRHSYHMHLPVFVSAFSGYGLPI